MFLRSKSLLALCIGVIALTVACAKSAMVTSPNSTAAADVAASADGSTLKIVAPALTAPIDGFVGIPGSTNPITLTLSNVAGKYTSIAVTYEFEVKNPAGAVVQNPKVVAGTTTTSTVIPLSSLVADTRYTWRARATSGTAFGPWSNTLTFRTPLGEGIFGNVIFDPLIGGHTVGKQRGGQFLAGQGWQALGLNDSIDYDIPTTAAATLEFDVTNVGYQEGLPFQADLKFVSMGDRNFFTDFGSFRDHPWKMHLTQRADTQDLEIVWRNGGTDPDGNPGDHRIKPTSNSGPLFGDSVVNHFVLAYDAFGYNISVSSNGGPLISYLSDGFGSDGSHPYAPTNMRISLGCYPRGETIPFSVYRNIKFTPK
jgi:hypothetical protein